MEYLKRQSVGNVKKSPDVAGGQEFIAVIVHQLRTPLSVIKFVTEELQRMEGKNLTESQHKKLAAIMEADERALNLVNNFLGAAALLGGEQHLEISECNPRHAFEIIVDTLRPMAAVKNQELVFTAPHEVEPVRICNEYLDRAFQNILDNAISYGDENSTVTVALKKLESEYEVSVNNRGPVIPENELPDMFQRFHRLPEAEAIKPSGSGLGLFIAKAGVELNGGRIWITSDKRDGTTVYFTIPLPKQTHGVIHG
ncbi:MAG: HAMP domain-containing sensor histidine kinase [bacterium]|nr:HAMP domain-containing sensor histidine kinase [bacterium]